MALMRVHAHHDHVFDAFLPHEVVDFVSLVADAVDGLDLEFGNFPRPNQAHRARLFVGTTAVGVVDGKRAFGNAGLRRISGLAGGSGLGDLAGPVIRVRADRLGGAVDDQYALLAELRHDKVHPRGHFRNPCFGCLAPVVIPHVADNHGRLVRVPMLGCRGKIEVARPLAVSRDCGDATPDGWPRRRPPT